MEKSNFTAFAKSEMLMNLPDKPCCRTAWIAAAVKAVGSLKIERKNNFLIFESEDFDYLQTVALFIKNLYFTEIEVSAVKSKNKKGGNAYTVKVPSGQTKEILRDTGLIYEDIEGETVFSGNISREAVESACCAAAFLRSLFIATGSANVPNKIIGEDEKISSNGGGYYLEFVLSDEVLAELVVGMLAFFSITARTVERKGKSVVYLKESETISNAFALMGANETVLYLQEIILERMFTNNLNRQSNCDAANADKSAIAAAKQVVAIRNIERIAGLDSLPEKLRELALLRLDNPTESLEFFAKELGDVGKSGINHRFRKILEIAEKYNTDGENR